MKDTKMVLSLLNELHSIIPLFDLEFYKEYIPYKMDAYRALEALEGGTTEEELESTIVEVDATIVPDKELTGGTNGK